MPRLSAVGISGLQVGEDVNMASLNTTAAYFEACNKKATRSHDWWPFFAEPSHAWAGAIYGDFLRH